MMKRKLKRLLRLRNSSGFTLVEVIIACALLGILILGMMGFITPVLTSVREKERNARAYMLSEAINTYISESIQYAYYIATFTGATSKDTYGSSAVIADLKYSGTEFSGSKDGCLKDMKTALDGKFPYEIKCIGFRWRQDQISGEWKLMVTNEKVEDDFTINPAKSKLIFEECFYEKLYPTVTFLNYNSQKPDEVGTSVNTDIAPGIGLVVDVYTTPNCYNVNSTAREEAIVSMRGTSYVGFSVMKSGILNKNGYYKVIPNQQINTFDSASSKDSSKKYTQDGNTYYSPESFIFYALRKNN